MDTKRCRRCLEVKPTTEFTRYKRKGKDGTWSYCRECWNQLKREKYYSREKQRLRDLRANYSISHEEYDTMLLAQDGRCAICNRTSEEVGNKRKQWLEVDHCHTTTEIRALLCSPCNSGIAHLGHNPERLEAAARYLRGH